ncbi:hypothetical protein [Stenoxybacter acetivorans]|uniref:hypothetical protein n=1 Tax=Stenoxybacter acetivorans TaxID=422441 RepID=UPI00146FF8F2|nr:hypothetical protein [Stenoxybacter acetivorans]
MNKAIWIKGLLFSGSLIIHRLPENRLAICFKNHSVLKSGLTQSFFSGLFISQYDIHRLE